MIIMAVDDEKLALEGLLKSIREAEPSAETVGFRKPSEAMVFFKEHTCDVVFLDIQMRGVNGVNLAKEMKLLRPEVNVIFATGYLDYMGEAFSLHASGYIVKPITTAKVRAELNDLRHPVQEAARSRVNIYTFGNFEVYVDGKTLPFKYEKTKEMLAYLVDRHGAFCSNGEIMTVLWEDERRTSYLGNLKKDLLDTLETAGCADVITQQRGRLGIVPQAIRCDYYDWCDGKRMGNAYLGEYMAQYSWSEYTNAALQQMT